MEIPFWAIVLVLILLILAFSTQIIFLLNSAKSSIVSAISGEEPTCMYTENMHEKNKMMNMKKERLTNRDPKENSNDMGSSINNKALEVLGYDAGQGASWNEVIKTTELDPSTFDNHESFVKDARIFSSGANFTSVTDDNTNLAFTNFIGLRRPSFPLNGIGPESRQIPDIDETVLAREKQFRWNSTS